eukprot:3394708-Pyramimonas_sp.AAC.1
MSAADAGMKTERPVQLAHPILRTTAHSEEQASEQYSLWSRAAERAFLSRDCAATHGDDEGMRGGRGAALHLATSAIAH